MRSPLPTSRPAAAPRLFEGDGSCGRVLRGLMLHGCVRTLVFSGADTGTPARFATVLGKIRTIVEQIRDAETPGGLLLMLDSYTLVLAMILHEDPRITPENCDYFRLQRDMLITPATLMDIGPHVRTLASNGNRDHIFLRLLEFTLPLYKHNRLHFPVLRECSYGGLAEMVRLVMATCLGIYPTSERRAVWSVRVQIWFFFWNLLSRANAYDLHLFCTQHVALVKLAIVEYFFYSLQFVLPVETTFLLRRTGGRGPAMCCQTAKSIAFHVDQFRQGSFCSDALDLAVAVSVATVSLEKCVRLWKARDTYAAAREGPGRSSTRVSEQELRRACRLALASPRVQHPVYLLHMARVDVATANLVHSLQQQVQVFPLPRNIMRQQYAYVEDALMSEGAAAMKLMHLDVCLNCGLQGRGKSHALDRKLRLNRNQAVCCSKCGTDETVAHINAVGRLVCVNGAYLYFCWRCRKVHPWCADGSDLLGRCPHEARSVAGAAPSARTCVLCERRSQVELYSVLDDRLGIQTRVPLCAWHTPPENMQKHVFNFDTLLEVLDIKHRDRRERRK